MESLEKCPLVLLITDYQGLIPQRITAYEGYDLGQITRLIEDAGGEVRILGAHELDFPSISKRRHMAAVYASSQKPRYRRYLQDIVANLHFSNVLLFPGFVHMLAHEDKGFQAMRLAISDIKTPRTVVFGNKQQAYEFLRKAAFPLVGKAPDGYGSRGVRLIRNVRQGRAFVDRHMVDRSLLKDRSFPVRAIQRVFKPRPVLGLLLFQELLPSLAGDWKILIWGDTACGLCRENRSRDFRASGSGKHAFIDVPAQILDFARTVTEKLDLPWASLDIAYDGKCCNLLEYQGIHFGLTTAEKGLFYYVRNAHGIWEKRLGRIQVETEMAKIIVRSLRQREWLPALSPNVGNMGHGMKLSS